MTLSDPCLSGSKLWLKDGLSIQNLTIPFDRHRRHRYFDSSPDPRPYARAVSDEKQHSASCSAGGARKRDRLTPDLIWIERVVEIAVLVVLAVPLIRLSVDPGIWRRFQAFPRMHAFMLGSLAIYACCIAALTFTSPGALRAAAAAAVIFSVVLKWQSRASHGLGRGLPAGSLEFLPGAPWRDPHYYRKQAEEHGPVFKFRHFTRPAVGIVGLERAGAFFRDNHEKLDVPPAPFNTIVPGGFVRYLDGTRHLDVSGVLRSAMTQAVVDACASDFAKESRIVLDSFAAAGAAGINPASAIDRMVLHDLMLCFFGVVPGPVLDRLATLYDKGDYRRLSRVGRARAAAAVFEIVHEVRRLVDHPLADPRAAPPPSFLAELVRLHPQAIMDDETMGNFVYSLHTARLDVAGLLMWLLVKAGENPAWIARLAIEMKQNSADSLKAGGLADRIVRETVRMHQSEFLMRRVTRPIQWDGYNIPTGWHVRVCVQESHRSTEFFDKPDVFDPDRFLYRPSRTRYSPFGMSSRLCPGEHLARSLGRHLVAELASRFEIELDHADPVEFSGFHWRPNSRLRTSLKLRT